MSEHRKKVLEMLASGRITPDEADQLLDRLDKPAEETVKSHSAEEFGTPAKKKIKFLRVDIQGKEGGPQPEAQVKVKVPLALLKTGLKLGALMPQDAKDQLDSQGINLSHLAELHGEELIQALADLDVNIESEQGCVKVYCDC
jgi:hypothetical protein